MFQASKKIRLAVNNNKYNNKYQTRLEDLPDEMLIEIFKYLPERYNLLSQVSKRFYSLLPENRSNHFSIITESFNMMCYFGKQKTPINICLKSLLNKGDFKYLNTCKKNFNRKFDYSSYAVKVGNINSLMWLIHNKFIIYKKLDIVAAFYGRLDMLIWIGKNLKKIDHCISQYAALNDQVHILKWLYKYGKLKYINTCFSRAIEKYSIKTLNWFYDENIYTNCDVYEYRVAVKNNNMDSINWLLEKNIPLNSSVLQVAIERDNLNILKYLFDKVKEVEEINIDLITIIRFSKISINIDMLEYLIVEKGINYNKNIVIGISASKGFLSLLDWFYEHECPLNSDTYLDALTYNTNKECIEWLIEKNCPNNNEDIFDTAVSNCSLEIIKLLYENNFPYNKEGAAITAIAERGKDICEWFYENNFDFHPKLSTKWAIENNNFETLVWLHEEKDFQIEDECFDIAFDLSTKTSIWLLDKVSIHKLSSENYLLYSLQDGLLDLAEEFYKMGLTGDKEKLMELSLDCDESKEWLIKRDIINNNRLNIAEDFDKISFSYP